MAPLLSDPLHKELALTLYVEELAAARWAWGECDCTLAVASWIERLHGIDPAKLFRGTYHTAEEARALVKRKGGFMPWIGMLLDRMGLERTQAPETGDVGIIIAPQAFRATMPVVGAIMAIRRDHLWIAKAAHGIVGQPFEAIVAWRT